MFLDGIKSFVAFGAHHDDVDLRCGGTFARLTRSGAAGCYAVVVENGYTGAHYNPTDRAAAVATRESECRAGAQALGASRIEFLRYKSFYLETPRARSRVFPSFTDRTALNDQLADVLFTDRPPVAGAVANDAWREPILALLRECRPQVVFTHSPDDRHADHYAVANLLCHIVCEHNADASEPVEIMFWEPGSAGVVAGFHPDTFVELDEADVAAKQRALDGFVSQFRREDIGDFAASRTAFYGQLCGVGHAEPFQRGTWPKDPPWGGPPSWAEPVANRRRDIRVWHLDGSQLETGNDR